MISRRTVLRTATTAAWTVPLVQIVGAAPALAVSGAQMKIAGGSADWRGTHLDIALPVQNDGSQKTANLQISLTFPPFWTPVPDGSPGWVPTEPFASGDQFTMIYTAAANLLPGQGTTAAITVKGKDHKPSGTVLVTITTTTSSVGTSLTIV